MSTNRTPRRLLLTALALTGLLIATVPGPASGSAFPGQSGPVTFYTNRDGGFRVYRVNANFTSPTNLSASRSSPPDRVPSWSERTVAASCST